MKKFISILLAMTLLCSTFMTTTVFATTDAKKETKIYFEVPELYGSPKSVYCYIYKVYGGKEIKRFNYGSNKTKCELVDEGRVLYAYDTAKLCLDSDTSGYAIDDNADYCAVFSVIYEGGENLQLNSMTFGSSCMGDEVYLDIPVGLEADFTARWKYNSENYGEAVHISGSGEITGEYYPVYQPREDIVANWLGTYAIYNEKEITTEFVTNLCDTVGADPQGVYDTYAQMYADELADPENNPTIAPLERVSILLGFENPAYMVVGTANLCGVDWTASPADAPYNMMTKVGDIYKKTFTDVQPTDNVQFKIINYTFEDEMPWWGCSDDKIFTFAVIDVCDITITYNPTTDEVEIIGDYVVIDSSFDFDTISIAGNGEGNWLNNFVWDTSQNHMTEIEENLYQITYEDIPAGEYYQFKFAADNSWKDNWGGVLTEFGVETDAMYNFDDNITFDLTSTSDVTITLDLRNYDGAQKSGAKFKVDITQQSMADANGDGAIDVNDATIIQKYAVGLVDEAQIDLDYADINADGIVNVEDATLIQKYLVGRYEIVK